MKRFNLLPANCAGCAMRGTTTKRKATFTLDDQLLHEAREIVQTGSFKSLNAFVQAAVEEYVRKMRQEKIRQSLVEASTDPLFLADIAEVEKDFEHADVEAGRIL